jgi:phage shock protein A
LRQSDEKLQEKIADADMRGNQWLSKAREAEERGNKELAEEYYRRGNYWLDRSNKLRGEC